MGPLRHTALGRDSSSYRKPRRNLPFAGFRMSRYQGRGAADTGHDRQSLETRDHFAQGLEPLADKVSHAKNAQPYETDGYPLEQATLRTFDPRVPIPSFGAA